MNTIHVINNNIKNITIDIQDRYPELYRFIDEMPVTIPDLEDPQIDLDNLETYYDSLSYLQQGYIINKPMDTKVFFLESYKDTTRWPEDVYPLYPVENYHYQLFNERKECLK